MTGSRWRTGRGGGGQGAANRVRLSQDRARSSVRLALLFVVAAGIAALTTERWLAIHLFLAGAVVLAISGVSLMLTTTWSAAPAPSRRLCAVQRWCVAGGAAGIAAARASDAGAAAYALAGTAYVVGLVLLGILLVATACRGVQRRFDTAVAAYVLAVAAGLAGVALGISMAVDGPTPWRRNAHVTLNLLGLVGLVVGGTLPFFASTVGRARMAGRATAASLAAAVAVQATALALAVVGLLAGRTGPAAAGLALYVASIAAVAVLLPPPDRRQLSWAGPRLLGLWAGTAWWAVAVGASAVDAAGGRNVFAGRWLVVLVVAAYAQILWGSLAYLLPVLRGGGHELLAEGFATTRSWLGLAAANAAGVCAAVGGPMVLVGIALALWLADSAWRAWGVGVRRAPRPPDAGAT